MDESVKHHFVPQYLLRNFACDTDKKFIQCFDKSTGRVFQNSIINSGSEKYFNTIRHEKGNFNFEYFFDEIDAKAAPLIAKIIAANSIANLSNSDRSLLLKTVAYQLQRVKMARTSVVEQQTQIKNLFELMGWSAKNVLVPTDEEIKAINLQALSDIEEVVKSLNEKIIQLQFFNEDVLMISDNPVVLHNGLPYGEMGLSSRGIEIYFPISPRCVIAFICVSSFEEIRSKYREGHFDKYINAFSLFPMRLESEHISFFNWLQIINSNRFLYKPDTEFSLAFQILEANPHLRAIRSKTVLGEMGKGPRPLQNMPAGDAIVIYGNRGNYMFAVSAVINDVDIEFVTTEIDMINRLQNDQPMKRATLYHDGSLCRHMAEPSFKKLELIEDKYIIRVGHADDSFRLILNEIRKNKKRSE